MRLLHLVLYSKDKYYDKMYDISRIYYKTFPNVITLYYLFDPELQTEYKLEGDLLYIRGNESIVPGVLIKTIKAFEYVSKNFEEYEYVIRTNISTIVNLNKILTLLEKTSSDYYGVQNLVGGFDKKYGIVDLKYHKRIYASGIAMIYKKALFLEILKNKDKLDYSVIDDVSLGMLALDLGKNLYSLSYKAAWVRPGHNIINICRDFIIFRNCNSRREIDIYNMKIITEQLTKNLV